MNYLEKKIKVFGAALDPNDDPLKILAKCTYINRLAQNLIDLQIEIVDPYDGLLKHSKILHQAKFVKLGKVPIESWLTPKPKIEDFHLLDPRTFQEFTNSGAVAEYSIKIESYIKEQILPDIPLMIGVDHSLTGGALGALSEKYGPENILVIIFDAHFDGIPAHISLDLARYAKEHKEEVNVLSPQQLELHDIEAIKIEDSYTCASFLEYIIEEGIILPENLILFGVQDYPGDEMQAEKDKRVLNFVKKYLDYEKKGVSFIPAQKETAKMIMKLKETLADRQTSFVYLSLDVDVSMFEEVLAARFMNAIGIKQSILMEAVKIIKKFITETSSELIGVDIMEIETFMLNKKLKKSGEKDKTIELIDGFISELF